MFKTWCIYVIALIVTFIFFLFYKMWVAWYCLVLLALLPAVSFLICLICARNLTFTVEIPPLLRKGDKASVKITIGGHVSILALVRFTATVTDRMEDKSETIMYTVHDKGTSKIPLDTSHCGAFSYKITELRIYDIFGFFHMDHKTDNSREIIIKPVPSMPHYMPDSNGIRARSLRKSNSPGSEIYDIREYNPGDSVKNIHWKISAKKDKLIVKEPLEEYAGHARVLLKLSNDRNEMDIHLAEMLFTSEYFLKKDISHKIRIIPPNKCEIAYEVSSYEDLNRAVLSILHMKLPKEA
ncbi:Protein of unknown function DUF58 [Oscillospiraceae bacterium]|nr:Protein of unknown function DUF58 [Oscillospiraceae bacterium]